jgi:metal-responsive CopG/Arc/MetJ family transcriptional regulator
VVSVTVPREVLAEAHELVQKAEISFSVYVAELLRVDLASRKKHQAAEQGKAA